MEFKGGASDEVFRLGDIGNYNETDDLISIGSAVIFIINISAILTRIGAIGGKSLNTYFDAFGLEGILANTSLIVILFQIARWIYTKAYAEGGRAWSPFVFVCILIGVQLLHDAIFYYGVIKTIPIGNNEMIDVLKNYAQENGSRALAGHAALLIFVAVAAMFLKERTLQFTAIVTIISLYSLPYVITTFGPRPPVVKEQKKESTGSRY